MFRKALNISIVLVLLFASLVPAQPALAQESHPSIVANVTGDWVEVWGLGPDDLTARLEVIRGEGSDIVCSQDYSPVSGNPWLDCPDSGIQAEDLILLIVNEIEVKSHIVLDFTLDEFGPADGYFAGTGPSGKSVWVSVCNPDLPCFDGMGIVNTDGFWEVSFGPDTVSPDAQIWATIWEEDGDSTQASFIPPPTIEVNHTTNWLSASGFQPDESTADLEVYAPGETLPKCSADYVLEGVFSVELNCWTTNVQPGDIVRLIVDGEQVNDLIVKPITITEYDPNAGIIRGTAPVSAYVQADICNAEGFCYSGEATKLGDGNWEMSFDPLPFNYVGWVGAHVIESDGDHSIAEYIHRVTDANVTGDWISAWGFGPDDLFASLVVNRGEGSDPICGGDFDLSEGDPWLECWQQGVDILPEDEVLLFVDGVGIKDHTVIDLTLDAVILEEGHFAGTAPEYSTVRVDVCNSEEDCYSGEYPLGENEETWQISFGQNLLSPDAWYGVYISDADGDSTYADYVPPPVLDVNITWDWISAWGFGPDDLFARLVVNRGEGSDPICEGDFNLSEEDPWLECSEQEVDILPGDEVLLFVDGEPVKDHIVFDLTLDIVDIESGYFEGTAPEWSTVRVDVCNPPFEECSSLEYDTEGSTIWAISFGSGAVDPEAWFGAFMMDDDGDQTMAEVLPPQEPPVMDVNVSGDWVSAWGFGPDDLSARLEVYEIYEQGDPYLKCEGDFDLSEGDPWLDCWEATILPGDLVILKVDGTAVKDHIVFDLTLDVVDIEGGYFEGTAPEWSTVWVDVCNPGEDCFSSEYLVGSDEIWEISFGSDTVSPDAWFAAFISDEDGDLTQAELPFQPEPEIPGINANPTAEWVAAYGLGQSYATARLEVYEVYEEGDPYLKCEGDFNLAGIQEIWLDCSEAMIEPGDQILLFLDGTQIKDHLVFDLTLDVFDHELGNFEGTAPQGETVWVDVCNPGEDCFSSEYLVGSDEIWAISFGLGTVSPDAWFAAFISDEDGDLTQAELPFQPEPDIPSIEANISGDSVYAWGFGPDATTATLEVYEVYEQGDPYLKCEGDFNLTEGEDPWLDCWEATIQPGDLVLLYLNDVQVKDHTVFALTLDVFIPGTGTFSGTAPEGETVRVDWCNPPCEEGFSGDYLVEEDGTWEISFGPDTISPDAWYGAFISDEDGDQTMAELTPPPTIDYTLYYNWLGLNGFPPDVEVLVQIFTDEETITETLFTNSHGGAGWDTMAYLSPGDVIVATYGDDEIVKDLVLENLTVDYFDLEADQAGGFAPTGTEVFYVLEGGEVEYLEDRVTADSSGWFVDFAFTYGIDLTEEMFFSVYVEDFDGDRTIAVLPEPLSPPSIRAYPEFDTIEATGFPFGETITLVIDDDLNPDNGNLYFDTGVAIEAPWSPDESWVSFYVGETVDLQPGHYVIMFFEDIFQVHQVTNLTITNINLNTKVISGTAEPFSGLFLLVNWAEETFVFTSADTNGDWFVDYTGISALSYGDLVIAGQPDSESNTTLVNRIIVTPGGLIDEIINLPEEELAPEIKNSIIKKIENALSSFLKGNTNSAIAKLEALLNQIEALRGNKISEETADLLNRLVWHMIRSFE